ncbi:MAG: universal stress protein [Myxococcales bacterium]|nr:universal stress protein [Myxococcales bacterium]
MNTVWIAAHDFSACSEVAVRQAARDAVIEGARLVLLHALDPEVLAAPVEWATGAVAVPMVSHLTEARAAARHRLERVADELRAEHPALETTVEVSEGHPVEVILEAAEQEEATRIIVGTHGRRGLRRLFLGSVAERVVRASPVPVLVVREP